MNKRIAVFALLVFALSGVACNRGYDGFNLHFWTSSPEFQSKHLVIDGVDHGSLALLASAPVCDDVSTKQDIIHLALPSGKYRIELKDESGRTGYSETLKIKRRGNSVSISTTTRARRGGSRNVVNNDCLIAEFYTK